VKKTRKFIAILCTLAFVMLCAGPVLAMPDTIKVGTDDFHVVLYETNQAIDNPVLLADMNNRLQTAIENDERIGGVTADGLIIDIGAALKNESGYADYERKVIAGAIEQGTDMEFDRVASVGSDGTVVIEPLVASGGDDTQAKEVLDKLTSFYLYGYNVLTSAYVEHESVPSTPILDRDNLSKAGITYTFSPIYLSKVQHFQSEKATEIYHALSGSVNSKYGTAAFSNDINVEFNLQNDKSKVNTLIKHIGYYPNWDIKVNNGVFNPSDYLSATFIDDVRNKTPDEIFSTYGPHLFKHYYIGGRVNMNIAYSHTTASALAAGDIKDTLSTLHSSTTLKTKYQQCLDELSSNSLEDFSFTGGEKVANPTYSNIQDMYISWVKTIDKLDQRQDLAGIGKIDESMVPLWNLLFSYKKDGSADPDLIKKGRQMRTRFYEMAGDRIITLDNVIPEVEAKFNYVPENPDDVITDLWVWAGDDPDDAHLPGADYHWVNEYGTENRLDFNKGAGGETEVFIAYKLGDPPRAESNIAHVIKHIYITGEKDQAKIKVDLNRGAGGRDLFLTYSDYGNCYYSEMKAVVSDKEDISPINGWDQITTDCNDHAGGKFIYIIMKRSSAQPAAIEPNLIPASAVSLQDSDGKTILNGAKLNNGKISIVFPSNVNFNSINESKIILENLSTMKTVPLSKDMFTLISNNNKNNKMTFDPKLADEDGCTFRITLKNGLEDSERNVLEEDIILQYYIKAKEDGSDTVTKV